MENPPVTENEFSLGAKDQRAYTETHERTESPLGTRADDEITLLNFNPYSKKTPFLTR